MLKIKENALIFTRIAIKGLVLFWSLDVLIMKTWHTSTL